MVCALNSTPTSKGPFGIWTGIWMKRAFIVPRKIGTRRGP
jgi:hypothetical protein